MIFPLNFKKRLYYFVVIDFCPPLSCFQPPAVSFLMLAYSFIFLCSFDFNTLDFTFFFFIIPGTTDIFRDSSFSLFQLLGAGDIHYCNVKTPSKQASTRTKMYFDWGTMSYMFHIILKNESLLLLPRPSGNSSFSFCKGGYGES